MTGYRRVPFPAARITPFITSFGRGRHCSNSWRKHTRLLNLQIENYRLKKARPLVTFQPMTADRTLRWMTGPIFMALLLAGCGRKPESAFTTWAKAPTAYTPSPSSGNAFDAYVIAAQQAETMAAKYRDRVFFSPGQRVAATEMVSKPFQDVVSATSLPCEFKFTATKPFEKPANHQGWRLHPLDGGSSRTDTTRTRHAALRAHGIFRDHK